MDAGESSCGEGVASSSPVNGKPVVVRVKRKSFQAPLEAFWLEINERPLKRQLLDISTLSISDSAGKVMEPSQETTSGGTGRKKGRGPTILSTLSKGSTGSKRIVEYNIHNQPIGDNSIKLSSYCGFLGRSLVPINIDGWRNVPIEAKDKVWTLIQEKFVVEDSRKKVIMQDVGIKWRGFKNKLTSLYIYPYLDDHSKFAKSPSEYPSIQQSHWDEFVKQRLTPEFQAKRDAQKEKQAKNICPHHTSRKGFARLREELKSTGGYTEDGEPDRSFIWKRSRQDKSGGYSNPATKEKADRIDELTQQLKEGDINTQGSNDILAMALDNLEHPGRVRGVGRFVTPTSYFNNPKRAVKRIPVEVQEQLDQYAQFFENATRKMADMQAQIDSLLSSRTTQESTKESEKIGSYGLKISTKGSVSPPSDPTTKPGQARQCYMFLENPKNIVAHGTYFEPMPSECIHGKPLREGNVRVSIGIAVEGKGHTQLPYPLEEEDVMCVNDAVNYIVEWPRAFLNRHPVVKPKADPSKEIEDFATCYRKNKSISIVIHLDRTVFGHTDFDVHLLSEDIVQLADMKKLSSSSMTIYMGYLADQLIRNDKESKFGLANPYTASDFYKNKDGKFVELIKELAKVYNCNVEKLILVPLNIGGHWVLLVLDFTSCTFYFFDPIRKPVRLEIRTVLLKTIQYLKGEDKSRKFKAIRWVNVKCPKQPNNTDCGFYVLRYLKEIVENDNDELSITQMFNDEKIEYAKEELDEVKIEWIAKVKEYIN